MVPEKPRKIIFFILIVSVFLTVPSATASTYIRVDDNTYDLLLRLEAEGVIKSSLLTTRPLSRKEVMRLVIEAERKYGESSIFIQSLIRSLKERFEVEAYNARFIKPVDLLYSRHVYADSDIQALYYNNDGDLYRKGSNLRVGFSSMAELGWLSFYLNPESRYSDNDEDLIVKRAYGILSFFRIGICHRQGFTMVGTRVSWIYTPFEQC